MSKELTSKERFEELKYAFKSRFVNIKERIEAIRIIYKLSRTEFANRLFISRAYINKIEKDLYMPSDILLKLISYEFCVPFRWLKLGEKTLEEAMKDEEKWLKNKDFIIKDLLNRVCVFEILEDVDRRRNENKNDFRYTDYF